MKKRITNMIKKLVSPSPIITKKNSNTYTVKSGNNVFKTVPRKPTRSPPRRQIMTKPRTKNTVIKPLVNATQKEFNTFMKRTHENWKKLKTYRNKRANSEKQAMMNLDRYINTMGPGSIKRLSRN